MNINEIIPEIENLVKDIKAIAETPDGSLRYLRAKLASCTGQIDPNHSNIDRDDIEKLGLKGFVKLLGAEGFAHVGCIIDNLTKPQSPEDLVAEMQRIEANTPGLSLEQFKGLATHGELDELLLNLMINEISNYVVENLRQEIRSLDADNVASSDRFYNIVRGYYRTALRNNKIPSHVIDKLLSKEDTKMSNEIIYTDTAMQLLSEVLKYKNLQAPPQEINDFIRTLAARLGVNHYADLGMNDPTRLVNGPGFPNSLMNELDRFAEKMKDGKLTHYKYLHKDELDYNVVLELKTRAAEMVRDRMAEEVLNLDIRDRNNVNRFLALLTQWRCQAILNTTEGVEMQRDAVKAFTSDTTTGNMDALLSTIEPIESPVVDILGGDDPTGTQILYAIKLLKRLKNATHTDVREIIEELYGCEDIMSGGGVSFDPIVPLQKAATEYIITMFRANRPAELIKDLRSNEGLDYVIEAYATTVYGINLSEHRGTDLYYANIATFKDGYLSYLDDVVRQELMGMLNISNKGSDADLTKAILNTKLTMLKNSDLKEDDIQKRIKSFNDFNS